jgi:electron transport complex protein RnfG
MTPEDDRAGQGASGEESSARAAPGSGDPSALRLVLTLGLAGMLSGVGLVMAYEFTLPAITANRAAALRRAVFEVVPGTDRMQKIVPEADGTWRPAAEGEDTEGIYAAYDSEGQFKGFAIAGEGSGFQDTIRLIYGFDPQRHRIIGMVVLESRETPGLGDRIYKDPDFAANFDDLAAKSESGGPIKVVKHGEKSTPHEVDAITGATISSRAVVKIINTANATWLDRLPAVEQVPPYQGPPVPPSQED